MGNIYENGIPNTEVQAKTLKEYLEREFGIDPENLDLELKNLEQNWYSKVDGKECCCAYSNAI